MSSETHHLHHEHDATASTGRFTIPTTLQRAHRLCISSTPEVRYGRTCNGTGSILLTAMDEIRAHAVI